MNELEFIEKVIRKTPKGKIFFLESIHKKFLVRDVRRVVTKLIKNGEIKRIIRGMYVRPKKCRYLKGEVLMPCSYEIVKGISKKTGEVIIEHGADAVNRIGLSTQVPVRAIYYTTGRSRQIKINGKFRIRLVHINPKKILLPGTVTGLVVTALWYLKDDGVNLITPLAIKKIHHRIEDKHFVELLKYIDKMPVWMKKVFVQYQNMQPDDPRLVEDLSSYYQG